MSDELEQIKLDHIETIQKINMMDIRELEKVIYRALMWGNKILICGCGGSAADAQHFAAELVVRFSNTRTRALAAIALTTDSSILTAVANDFSFSSVFSRQIEALGKKGDVGVFITTSGKSLSILKARKTAAQLKMTTITLTGSPGEDFAMECDYGYVVESNETARIQEAHGFVIHSICHLLEKENWIPYDY